MTEGVSLYKDGINPYSGDMFHETPVGLAFYTQLINYMSPFLPAVFIVLDLITCQLLYLTAVEYMKHLVRIAVLKLFSSLYCLLHDECLLCRCSVKKKKR